MVCCERVDTGKIDSPAGKVRRNLRFLDYADKHDYGNMYKAISKAGNTRKVQLAVTPDLPTCRTYFQQLLTVQVEVTDNVHQYLPVQREIDNELAAPFTMMELETALAKMKDGAAPGEDGIPAEAYKYGGHDVKDLDSLSGTGPGCCPTRLEKRYTHTSA